MQEENKKEKWGKPKLIILIRGKPEEGVLQGCKTKTLGNDATAAATGCGRKAGAACNECSALTAS